MVVATPIGSAERTIHDPAAPALDRAEALMDARDGRHAMRMLDDVLEDYPTHRRALHLKVKLLATTGKLDEAQSIIDPLMQDQPVAAVTLYMQGLIYSRRNDWENALVYYKQAYPYGHDKYSINTITRAYLNVEGTDATFAFLTAHLEKFPEESHVRFVRAKLYQSQHQFEDARADYDALVRAEPENPVPWKNLADMLIEQGDKRAVSHARTAYELAPKVPEIMVTLGRALLAFGEAEDALAVLSDARKARPRDPEIAYEYAVALFATGEPAEANTIMNTLAASDTAIGLRARRYLAAPKN
ncbi:MAG: tetratricopeptide repeat protein [Chromatocurvus sp.]